VLWVPSKRSRLHHLWLLAQSIRTRYLVEAAKPVDPQWLAKEIILVEFGQSVLFIRPPAKEDIDITFSYCAPEVIFDTNVGPYSEMWALGCVLFEIRGGRQLCY